MKSFFLLTILFSFGATASDCLTDHLEPPASENMSTKSVAYRGTLWEPGSTLNVHFLDGSNIDKWWVRVYAKQWMKHANIKFLFFRGAPAEGQVSHIRITFKEDGNWSYIGTGNLNIPRKNPTMSLEDPGKWYTLWFQKRRTVIHEFGHALGLAHEHRSPAFPYTWDEPEVLKYCDQKLGWGENKCRHNILNPLEPGSVINGGFDPDSIMLYSMPKRLTEERKRLKWKTCLSEEDKERIAQLYP